MKPATLVLLSLITMFSANIVAQTKLNYNQTLANPTQLFPELSGWHGGLQTNVGYRNQWPGIPATYVNYTVGVDGYVHSIRSGVGMVTNHFRAGSGLVNTSSMDLSISPKLKLGEKTVFMPAVSLQFGSIAIDWSNMVYSTGIIYSSSSNPITQNINYIGVGGGVGLIQNKLFIAAHSENINRPNVSFFPNAENRLPRTYEFLAGRNFNIGKFTLTPSAIYQYYGGFQYWSVSANAQYKSVYLSARAGNVGIWAVGAGYEFNQRVRVSYGYDITASRLSTQTWGSHELMLRVWLFKDKAKKQFLSNLPLM